MCTKNIKKLLTHLLGLYLGLIPKVPILDTAEPHRICNYIKLDDEAFDKKRPSTVEDLLAFLLESELLVIRLTEKPLSPGSPLFIAGFLLHCHTSAGFFFFFFRQRGKLAA